MWMQCLIIQNCFCTSCRIKYRVILYCLCNLIIHFVCHIILKYIQNEMLLNSLPHGIDMEWMIHTFRILCSKHLQGLSLWSCSKCKEGQVLMNTLRSQFIQKTVFIILSVLLVLFFHLGIFFQNLFCICQCSF